MASFRSLLGSPLDLNRLLSTNPNIKVNKVTEVDPDMPTKFQLIVPSSRKDMVAGNKAFVLNKPRAATSQPITFTRDIVGLTTSPTILLHVGSEDGIVIEDVTVDAEPVYEIAKPLEACTINIQRNEAITCTTAFLSAETLLPNEDKRKKKVVGSTNDVNPEGSDDGMEAGEEQNQILGDFIASADIEIKTEKDDDFGGFHIKEVRSGIEYDEAQCTKRKDVNCNDATEPPKKRQKTEGSESEQTTANSKDNSTDNVFAGCSEGNIVAREVNLNELLELNKMMDIGENSEGEETGTVRDDSKNSSKVLDSSLEKDNSIVIISETKDEDSSDMNTGVTDNTDEKENKTTDCTTANSLKTDDKEPEEEEVVGSTWLDDYIDEFEEENQASEVTEEEIKVEEEEVLQDDGFTRDNLEQYLSYMGLINATGRPASAHDVLICEKCLMKFAGVNYLYKHLEEKPLCMAMYKVMESATFAKDPQVERKDHGGYMEVFGCYACSYNSYDPSEVRQHWLREHLEDGMYLCRYCYAEFHTSFRCALHVLQYHGEQPLHVALAPSPLYRQHVIFDLEPMRHDLYEQIASQMTAECRSKIQREPQLLPKNLKDVNGQNVDDCVLRCKHCSTEQIFETASALRGHINMCHRAVMRCFRCSLCFRHFPGQFDLRRHVAFAHQRFIGNARMFSDFDSSKVQKLIQKCLYTNFPEFHDSMNLPFVCHRCYDRKQTTGKGSVECFASEVELSVHVGKEHLCLKKINCLSCNRPYNDKGWCADCQADVDIVHRCYLDAITAGGMGATQRRGGQGSKINDRRLLVCSVCCFKAEERSSLLTHIKNAHTLWRPYKCSHCNYAALDLSRMLRHESNAHGLTNTSVDLINSKPCSLKGVLDAVAYSLILTIPANDRHIILFEGDTMLDEVLPIEAETNQFNLQLVEGGERVKMLHFNTAKRATGKHANKARWINSSVKPQWLKEGKLRPHIINRSLYLDVEEPIVPVSMPVIKEEIVDVAGDQLMAEQGEEGGSGSKASTEEQELKKEQMEMRIEDKYQDLFSSNITGDRIGNPPNFKCHWCPFQTNKHGKLIEHLQVTHMTSDMGNQGQYWQCFLCGYCAKDRSCIGRHVKYIHMTRRPHACPYCDYNSIEKTKVRLHITGNHKTEPVVVRTDEVLSHLMSQAVKRYIYFVRGAKIDWCP